jgi:hypothetical protein
LDWLVALLILIDLPITLYCFYLIGWVACWGIRQLPNWAQKTFGCLVLASAVMLFLLDAVHLIQLPSLLAALYLVSIFFTLFGPMLLLITFGSSLAITLILRARRGRRDLLPRLVSSAACFLAILGQCLYFGRFSLWTGSF